MAKDPASQVIFTNKARCRDCYRCVRVCPVKAIRMHEGQAFVVEERCIGCGTCIRECPQGAKSYRNDVDRARRLIDSEVRVAASVAPSFAAAYPDWQRRRLPSALRRLGFSYVGETAVGAYDVAEATAAAVNRQPRRSHVCTACPAVVRYVERYRPEALDRLVPVVSPMLAHALHIGRMQGEDVRVVFIGPCVAKKAEAERPEHAGIVDCVLTFAELDEWLQREGIDLSACEESDFDETPQGESRLFALEGGCLRTAGLKTDLLDGELVAVSGFEEVCSVLEQVTDPNAPRLIEPLFCPQGCINGPAMTGGENRFTRRGAVLRYAAGARGTVRTESPEGIERSQVDPSLPLSACDELRTRFTARRPPKETTVSEQEIRHVMEMTGKAKPEDQLSSGPTGSSRPAPTGSSSSTSTCGSCT
jgi:iron only hydrogenase large subunit-like protein